jgi:hypothetical protein
MKRVAQIDVDTPLRPRAVAEGVWEEASVWLGRPLPRRWLRELIAEAKTVYVHNARFRRKMRANGDSGREWLWLFARHWLAALIHEPRPELHKHLPASYNRGEGLDLHGVEKGCSAKKWAAPRRAKMDNGHGWVLAAHFHV